MHSALKKDGRALYEYARAGIEVERTAREIEIFKLDVIDPCVDGSPSAIKIRVFCSKGTYIRTLGEDIGEALGCGAHLASLRRIATGPFGLERCVTLAALEAMDEAQRERCLLPVEALLDDHSPLTLEAVDVARFLNGVRRRGSWPDQARVAVYGPAGQCAAGNRPGGGWRADSVPPAEPD
jgi:tRNA pseudouridine55 synthase